MVIKSILKAGSYGTENENRTKISTMTSFAGLFLNLLLSAIKMLLFLFTGSVSILADAINNVTDSVSSVVTIIGVKIAVKPADKEHPYGHGRIEYIVALIISAFVLVAGFEFVKVSYERIINPKEIKYSFVSIGLMFFSIIVKFYMAKMYKGISKRIDSTPLLAQYKDSLGDVFITSVVLLSILVYKFTGILVDGHVGMLVSLFIIYSGYELIRDTLSDLIGEAPDEELIKEIEKIVLSYDDILGIHDIIISKYGPQKTFVTLDAELPYDMSLTEAHIIIDSAERAVKDELDCEISIHVDPVGAYSLVEKEIARILENLIKEDNPVISFHDLLMEEDLISVEVVIDGDLVKSDKDIEEIKEYISKKIMIDDNFKYDLEIDRSF